MSNQEHLSESGLSGSNSAGNPSLVDVTNQMGVPHVSPQGAQPQVVFLGKKDQNPRRLEITVTSKSASENTAAPSTSRANSVQNGSLDGQAENEIAPSNQGAPVDYLASQDQEPGRFAFDPFELEVEGSMPSLPTLPIVKAKEMTEKVVSREKAGEHYAWRLSPGPYPDLGNASEVHAEEVNVANPDLSLGCQVTQEVNYKSDVEMPNHVEMTESQANTTWSETEVVTEADHYGSYGDNFYAKPGDVIAIDGNQGYDHIDLRSYSLNDATFEPGAIHLNSIDDDGHQASPITIRHRGVGFAIFNGEVRVDL